MEAPVAPAQRVGLQLAVHGQRERGLSPALATGNRPAPAAGSRATAEQGAKRPWDDAW